MIYPKPDYKTKIKRVSCVCGNCGKFDNCVLFAQILNNYKINEKEINLFHDILSFSGCREWVEE